VAVEGDVDGNGTPDVTLRGGLSETPCERCGLQIASSGNRLHALTLEGFGTGVLIQPYWDSTAGGAFPSRRTIADNVLSRLVMSKIDAVGIWIRSVFSPNCGVPQPQRCQSHGRWRNMTFTGNSIETASTGIAASIHHVGERLEHVTVTENTIRIDGNDAGIKFETGGDSLEGRISDVLIARNTIAGRVGIGISVAAGVQRGQANITQRVRVLDNRVNLVSPGSDYCCAGIVVNAGSDTAEAAFPDASPLRYPDGNVVREVEIRGNAVSGTLDAGVSVMAGVGAGGSKNRVENIRIERNTVRSSRVAGGMRLMIGNGQPFKKRYATGNRITGVTISVNRITVGKDPGETNVPLTGGVVLMAGGRFGRLGVVRDVRITDNRIATALAGIRLVGGLESTSRGNRVACVRLARNRITGTRKAVVVTSNVPGPKPGVPGASGNRASLGSC